MQINYNDCPHSIVNLRTGFLPESVETLPSNHPTRVAFDQVKSSTSDESKKQIIETLPPMRASEYPQKTWEYIFLLLNMLVNRYCKIPNVDPRRIPSGLEASLMSFSRALKRVPALTYHSIVLNNWRRKKGKENAPLDTLELDDIEPILTFTDIPDEGNFYCIHVKIELIGTRIVRKILQLKERAEGDFREEDKTYIFSALEEITCSIQEINRYVDEMHKRVKPAIFFHQLRGFFNRPANGIELDGKQYVFPGPSGAQSVLFPLLDIFCDIEYEKSLREIMNRFRQMWPEEHQDFLLHMENLGIGIRIREYLLQEKDSRMICYVDSVDNSSNFI